MNPPDHLPAVLIVDDEPGVLEAVKVILSEDFRVLTASTGSQALEKVCQDTVSLVFLDIKLPDMSGLEVLKRLKEFDPTITVVMATATDTVRTIVEAVRLGAFHYLLKPFDADEVLTIAQQALEQRRLLREVACLRSQRQAVTFANIVGESKEIREVFKTIEAVNGNDATVLISGESGTGKELVARAIHATGSRKNRPFVAVDCAGIPDTLLESELFGYEKGAFTGAVSQRLGIFELANEGTLFLDEIANLKLEMQAKLLRVLEEREVRRLGGSKTIKVDVRIIAATNADLKKAVKEGAFRQDLFYRLNVISVWLPPLRQRQGDVPLLLSHFLHVYNQTCKKDIEGFSREALECLSVYSWPGNVRELKNVVERLVALGNSGCICHHDLPVDIRVKSQALGHLRRSSTFKDACADFEKQFIQSVLESVAGNQGKAAGILGIHRNSLALKIKEFGLKAG